MSEQLETGDVVKLGGHAPCYDMIDGIFEIKYPATKTDSAGHNIVGYLVTYKEMLVWIDAYMVIEVYKPIAHKYTAPKSESSDAVGDIPF